LVKEVSNNSGYEAESDALKYKLYYKSKHQKQKTMFIHTNQEEVTHLPMDHNGVSITDECMSHQTHCVTK